MTSHILVIEDSSTMRSLIASTLEELDGVEVIEANNAFEALMPPVGVHPIGAPGPGGAWRGRSEAAT